MMFLFPVVGTIASLVVNPARVCWSHPMFAVEGFLQSRSMTVSESAVAEYFVMYESGSLSVGSFVLQLSLVFGTLLGEVVPSNWILAPLLRSVDGCGDNYIAIVIGGKTGCVKFSPPGRRRCGCPCSIIPKEVFKRIEPESENSGRGVVCLCFSS